MKPKDIYVLSDFTEHADKSSPDGLAAFKTLSDLQFSTKTYVDEHQAPHQVDMLLVGHYWYRCGGTVTWACATGTAVHYFYGSRFETVCTPVPEYRRSRIYFDPPFSTAAATQQTRSGNTGWLESRIVGFHISEAVINYLFLHTSRLKQVENRENVDMLGNFEYACAAAASQATGTNARAQSELGPAETDDDTLMHPDSNRKRKRTLEHPRIKEEIDVADDVGAHRSNRGISHCFMLHRPFTD